MSTGGDTIEAQRDEIRAWLAPGVDIDIREPTTESPLYRAVIAEFDLIGEGRTYEEAFDAVVGRFTTFLADLIAEDAPLPDRSVWLAKHPRPPDSGDE